MIVTGSGENEDAVPAAKKMDVSKGKLRIPVPREWHD